MGIFRKKKAAVLEESVIAAEKDDIKENDAAVKQMAKYQKKQVQSVMEEDLKMTQDIQRIHKEFHRGLGALIPQTGFHQNGVQRIGTGRICMVDQISLIAFQLLADDIIPSIGRLLLRNQQRNKLPIGMQLMQR